MKLLRWLTIAVGVTLVSAGVLGVAAGEALGHYLSPRTILLMVLAGVLGVVVLTLVPVFDGTLYHGEQDQSHLAAKNDAPPSPHRR